jgi:DNA replication protein DnaC
MSEHTFAVEKLVIISSKEEINMSQWRRYLKDNWERLMPARTRLLVLAGIHGCEDGALGVKEDIEEDGFVADSRKQMEILKKTKAEDIAKKDISINVEDIGRHGDMTELDLDKLTIAVKEFDPTVILLAFCWSEKSELNDVLRSAGIYTGMVLRDERAQIIESRHVELDEGQKDFIRTITEKKPRNIFLWGSSGSGKTLLMIEALLMKISQYTREGRQLQVIVTYYWAESN